MVITINDKLVEQAIKECGGVDVKPLDIEYYLKQIYLSNLTDDVDYILEM